MEINISLAQASFEDFFMASRPIIGKQFWRYSHNGHGFDPVREISQSTDWAALNVQCGEDMIFVENKREPQVILPMAVRPAERSDIADGNSLLYGRMVYRFRESGDSGSPDILKPLPITHSIDRVWLGDLLKSEKLYVHDWQRSLGWKTKSNPKQLVAS